MRKISRKTIKKDKGFSIIELIVYIALVSIFVTASVLFAWDVIYGRVKSEIEREVNANFRLATKKISYEIRNAGGINFINSTRLGLAGQPASRDPVEISLTDGRIMFGYGNSGNCSVNVPCALTSNLVEVTNLSFRDLSIGTSSANITFDISLQSTSDRKEWQSTVDGSVTAEIRSSSLAGSPTPTPTTTPTPTPSSCSQYCQDSGYTGGICRANSNQCTGGEVYEPAGDQYCPGGGGDDTCCCL